MTSDSLTAPTDSSQAPPLAEFAHSAVVQGADRGRGRGGGGGGGGGSDSETYSDVDSDTGL